MKNDPRVDVIITVSRPDTLFYNCIKRLLKQTIAVRKIIIVCFEESGDVECISDKMEVHCYLGQNRAVSELKNYGASFSDGDILVFINPESKAYNKYTLERLTKPLLNGDGISASFARSLARSECNEPERYELIYYYPRESFVISPDTKDNGRRLSPLGYDCAAYIKSVFNKAEGYDESFYSEDLLLALELLEMGESVAYCGDSVVVSSNNYSPLGQFKRYFDIGVFQKKALKRYGYGLDRNGEARLGLKGELYLLDYKEYLWMGYDVFYKGAKYLGYLFGSSFDALPKALRSLMSFHPEQFK
ncbi:MAG: hypothetical protein IK152_04050 [Lachnospiraceae bacterium]|nr:hypothetical protein [Lachnospiraceae bacterium]